MKITEHSHLFKFAKSVAAKYVFDPLYIYKYKIYIPILRKIRSLHNIFTVIHKTGNKKVFFKGIYVKANGMSLQAS